MNNDKPRLEIVDYLYIHFHQKSNLSIVIKNYGMEVRLWFMERMCVKMQKYFFFDFHFKIFLHFKYIASGGDVK